MDTKTVLISYLISNAICAAVIVALWQQNRKKFNGLGFWLVAYIIQFAGLVLIIMPVYLLEFVSVVVGNGFLVGGTILLYMGLEHFLGKRSNQFHNYILLALFVAVHINFLVVRPNMTARSLNFSFVLLALCTQSVWLIFRRTDVKLRPVVRGAGFVFAAYGAVSLIRICVYSVMPLDDDFSQLDSFNTIVILAYQTLFIALTFSLFLMVNRCLLMGLQEDMVIRQHDEDASKISEQQYRNFIAQSFEAISRTEFDHPIDITLPVEEQIDRIYENAFMAECNQAMADMYHVPSPEAFSGMRLIDAHGGKDDPINRKTFRKLIENGYKSVNDETKEYTVDGKPIWFLSNTIGMVENGYLVRLWGTAIDITEQKRMEVALRASEASMRSLIENVKDIFVRYDLSLRYQYVSPVIQRFLDATPESFIGKTHREAGFPEDKAEFFDASLREAIESKKPVDVEFSLQGRSGEYIMQTRVYPELDEKGEVVSVVTVTSDITERKRMEEALVRSQGLYQDLVERQVVGVYRIRVQKYFSWEAPEEPHYEYEFMNDEYCRLTGVSREEHMADPALTLKMIHPEDYPSFAQKNEEVDVTLEPFLWEGRMIIRGETRWVHYESCPRHFSDKGEVWTGVLMDITERKMAEELIHMRLRLLEYANDHSIEELLQKALDEICLFTNSPIGFYHFIEPDQKTVSLQAWSTRTLTEFCRAEGRGIHYDIDQAGVWVDCIHQRKPVIHNDYASLPHRKGLPPDHAEVKCELVVPILREGNVVSILGIGNKPSNYNEKDSEYVSYVADIVWTIVERKQVAEALQQAIETLHTQLVEIHALKETLQEQAIRDPLTKLHNRRYLDETLEHEVARAKRENYPLNIMMIDIDYFKNFNDIYGHSAGDEVLKSVSRLLVTSIRQGDIACRYGGEEFLIVLIGAHEADVERRAEAIRSDFSRLRIRSDKTELSATISIGVAFYPRHGAEIQQVIGAADAAMYQAKQAGRNRIQVWQEGE